MKKLNYLILSGLSLALSGLGMLFVDTIGVPTAKLLIPILIIATGLFAYLFSQANKHFKIAHQYHLIQALGLTVCGLLIAIVPKSLEDFLNFIAYFVLLSGLLEFIFAFMVLNARIKKISWGTLFSRFGTAILSFIAAFVLLFQSMSSPTKGLIIAGIVTILGGFSFLVFANKIKNVSPGDLI